MVRFHARRRAALLLPALLAAVLPTLPGASFVGVLAAPSPALQVLRSEFVYAVTPKNELIGFDSLLPQRPSTRVTVTGLAADESLVGIDFRPATGRLYGVGTSSQVYVIDTASGVASRIGAPFAPALTGTEFDVDFNPAVDRIRVVSNTGQNLRLNPDTGAVAAVDLQLNFAAADRNAGAAPSIAAAAYTNSDNDPATGTTLYDLDSNLDVLTTQNPPNNGTLNTVGPLNVAAGAIAGFDIGTPRGNSAGEAFAALQPAGSTSVRLYQVDLATGFALEIGPIGNAEPIRDIAVAQRSARYQQAYAITAGNQLVGLGTGTPGNVAFRATLTGLVPGERMVGIDFRPATGRLYGVGSTSQLYVINHYTGAAERVGAPFAPALNGTEFGVDFNPTVDRIRVVSDADQNLRVNPDTGAVAAVDLTLNYAPTDLNVGIHPNVVAAAYTNNDTNPATGTTLYDIDSNLDVLATQNPPNNGVLNTIGPLGVDAGAVVGFDILTTTSAGGPPSNVALAALQPLGSFGTRLFSVNLTTGRVRDQGAIGTQSDAIRDIAIPIPVAPAGRSF
jgi:hypothetical protein